MFAIYIKKTESLNEKLKILGWWPEKHQLHYFFFNDGTMIENGKTMHEEIIILKLCLSMVPLFQH
jgi:hypothetical protein